MTDNLTENVISLRSRKPLHQTIVEENQSAAERADMNIKAHLETIDNMRRLVETGRLQGLVLLARDTQTGLFYHDVIFPFKDGEAGCPPQEALLYTGFIETVKIQFADLASWAPTILSDGTVAAPEPIDEEDF